MKYENECSRCGFCCLVSTCPAGMFFHRIGEAEACPSLSFGDDGVANCALAKAGLVPIGDGCCIKARAYKDGVEYNFADLPTNLKRRAVADALRR